MPDFGNSFLAVMVFSLIAAFWAESLLPLQDREHDIPHIGRNLAIWCLAFLLADIAIGSWWLDIPSIVDQQPFGLFYWYPLPEPWLLAAVGVVLADLVDYLFHRLEHRVPMLWRIHAVHHSDPELDVSTTLRVHPLDLALSNFWLFGWLLALGLPLWLMAFRELLLWPLLFFQHANVRWPPRLERALGLVLVTPAIHRHHHSIRRSEHDSNYGDGLILWDRLFGSFQEPAAPTPLHCGVTGAGDTAAGTLRGMLLAPFRAT